MKPLLYWISVATILIVFGSKIQARVPFVSNLDEDSPPSDAAIDLDGDDFEDLDGGEPIPTVKEMEPIVEMDRGENNVDDQNYQNQSQPNIFESSDPQRQGQQQSAEYPQQMDPRQNMMPGGGGGGGYQDSMQQPETCGDGQYMCLKVNPDQAHIRCIPNEWKCNGVRDCEENDDESSCGGGGGPLDPGHQQMSPHHQHSPHEPETCQADMHHCYATGLPGIPIKCLYRQQVCDGRSDCPYGDDERTCPPEPDQQQMHQHQQQQQQQQSGHDQHRPYPGYDSQQQQQQQQLQQQQHQQHQQQLGGNGGSDRRGGGDPTGGNGAGGGGGGGSECRGSRSEEYIKRLEFLDRCYRSCMRYQI